jgi:hypothetical protein
MKLLRLTTDDESAVFDNTFNSNLIIAPNSKIALQSISIATLTTILDVDSSNHNVFYQVSTNIVKNITLQHANYTRINYTDLFTDMRLKFNSNSGFIPAPSPQTDRRELGIEWAVGIDSKNKVSIKYSHGTNAEHINNWDYDATKVERLQSNNRQVWRQKVGQPNDGNNDRSMLFNSYVSLGCGFIRCRVNKFDIEPSPTTPSTNGFMIGFSKVDITAKKPNEIVDSDLTWGIMISNDNAGTRQYAPVADGVVFDPYPEAPTYNGEGAVDNDFIEVIKNFDTITIALYQSGNPNVVVLATIPHPNSDEKLYPFVVFRGGNCDLNSLRVTPSPFANNAFGFSNVTEDLSADSLYAPPIPQRNPSQNYLELSPSVADFMGYNNPRNPQAGYYNVVNYNYIAERNFEPTDIADAFMVELLNIKVESYDGLREQRKNILAIVPSSNKEGEVIYETNQPLFIDMNNPKELLLRNIRVRVVKPDYSSVLMVGQATMVILIDG